jgi:hypothetical protein
LSDDTLEPSDWEEEFLDQQGVHQFPICAYIEAVQIWNKMVDLGMVEGERVDDADAFIDPAGTDLAKWYNVPENGYGINWPWSD